MEDRTFRRLAALEDLAEMGQDLARLVRRQAYARAEAESRDAAALAHDGRLSEARVSDGRNDFARTGGGDLGLVFARIARAVRQTWALHDRLDKERQARADETEVRRAAWAKEQLKTDLEDQARAREEAKQRGEARTNTVLEAVGQALEAECEDRGVDLEDDDEALERYRTLHERLDDPRDKADFIDLPISELVARICRELGVIPDWSLWEDEDWAIEEAEAQVPGSPYAAEPGSAIGNDPGVGGEVAEDPPP